jgi:hypothetical protein
MRLLLIAAVVIGVLVFAGVKIKGYFGKAGVEERQKAAGLTPSKDVQKAPSMEMPEANKSVHGEASEEVVVSIGSYTFQNRVAPEPPAVLRGENSMRARCELDAVTNSWVWFCTPHQAEQIRGLALAFDRRQQEMDLEFCLLLVNQDKIRSMGLSVLYNPGASWLTALKLDGDAGSLRLSLDNVAVDVTMQHTDAAAMVLQVPVLRVMESVPWTFDDSTEVAIPESDVVNNVVRNSVKYRKIGFGLSGVVRITGNDVVLNVKQNNGSILHRPTTQGEYPEFGTQELNTSCRMSWWEWSVLGGIQVDRKAVLKGWFSDKVQETTDYLVIFVRPRLSLSAPPRAVPAGSSRKPQAKDRGEHPLLPVKGWSDFPDGVPTSSIPLPEK